MENEELELVIELKKQIEEKQELIKKINNLDDYADKESAIKTINKDTMVERGRLLKLFKSKLKDINALYDKYDMYINIYEILNRAENENYTSVDKINDIKNSMVKTEYTEFEEKILNIINSNLDNLDEMKDELYKLDENKGIKELIGLKDTYSDELKKHKEVINARYSNEFIHKKATIPTIFTVLPKAVSLAVKKVATCIKEQKEAKTNKQKVNRFFKTLGAMGQVVATPVIYAGKFIIDHWYLLLLGLSMLGSILKWPWLWPFGKKKKDDDEKNKNDGEPQKQEQEQEALEHANEPVLVTDEEPQLEPVPGLKPVPAADPVMAAEPEHGNAMAGDPRFVAPKRPAIDYTSDPRFQAPKEPVVAVEPELGNAMAGDPRFEAPARPAIDYTSDPRFQAPKEPVVAAEPELGNAMAGDPRFEAPARPAIDYTSDPRFQAPKEPVVAAEPDPVTVAEEAMETYNISPEQAEQVSEQYTHTLDRLNERSNGQFFIREVHGASVDYPDIVICRTPMEYLQACSELADLDPVEMGFVDSNNVITKAGYEFMLERNIGTFGQDTRWNSIIFEDPTEQYKAEFENGMGYSCGSMYDRFTTVRCFETVEDFNAALVSNDPIYDGMREEFLREMNVSESQEALHCLGTLGLILAGGAVIELAPAAAATLAANAPNVIQGLQTLINIVSTNPANAYCMNDIVQAVPAL